MRTMLSAMRIGTLAVSLLAIVVAGGCLKRYIPIETRRPIIEVPERPELPVISAEQLAPLDEEVREQIFKMVADLKAYAQKYAVSVELYNNYARERNRKYDLLIGREQEGE